ncbi:ABC-type multidrug transport system ATPase subunit [Allocatelliglobosispora scoriae]|uniref:ABC-type multidrug transport system ATPase subunit n=1 Tax=Allocatelliglobosispora scoriae TaxID=643052 RepID=A0A841BPG1_9ACTN|nr:ABC-type multidrug transport system ATPase subunit [Allocatelliglobosispora scoriae]
MREKNSFALAAIGLRKAFGTKIAVDDPDLMVPAGSLFGLDGPNGVGKTTTLSMKTGPRDHEAASGTKHGARAGRM